MSEAVADYAVVRRSRQRRRVTLLGLGAGLALAALPRAAGAQAQRDIVDTAAAAGQFNTLAQALQAAGLVETLRGAGPFTVFAPTDAAFNRLPPGTLQALLNNQPQLRSVLTYHVSPGRATAAQLAGQPQAGTVQGEPIRIAATGGTVRLNGAATVVQADVAASNGVIHVIDAVLLPPTLAAQGLPQAGLASPAALAGVPAALALLAGGLYLRRRASSEPAAEHAEDRAEDRAG